jgi:hypothetical protein
MYATKLGGGVPFAEPMKYESTILRVLCKEWDTLTASSSASCAHPPTNILQQYKQMQRVRR